MLTIRTFLFSRPLSAPPSACTANFAPSFSIGPPGDRGALQCHWNAIATTQLGLVPAPGFRLAAFYQKMKSKAGLAAAKAAALRALGINLN
jgi:hypothetical protein